MRPSVSPLLRGALICLAFLPCAADAHAQAEPLAAGREVRLYVRGVIRPFEGELQQVGAGDLALVTPDGSVLTIGLEQIERSEVRGTRKNTWLGAGVGAAFGLGVGIWRVVEHRNDCGIGSATFCDPGKDPLRLAIPTVVGASAGALVGFFIHTDTWLAGYVPTLAGGGPAGMALAWTIPLGS